LLSITISQALLEDGIMNRLEEVIAMSIAPHHSNMSLEEYLIFEKNDSVELNSLNVRFPIEMLYENVTFSDDIQPG
jgi:hypothetical protein